MFYSPPYLPGKYVDTRIKALQYQTNQVVDVTSPSFSAPLRNARLSLGRVSSALAIELQAACRSQQRVAAQSKE